MAKRPAKKRLSKKKQASGTARPPDSLSEDEDWEVKEARLKALLVDQAKRALKLRSKDREFHGLEREFRDHQAQMTLDYDRTKDLKHPRDVGDSREKILRKFLASTASLPSRYTRYLTAVFASSQRQAI
jgi:hypothetical protein